MRNSRILLFVLITLSLATYYVVFFKEKKESEELKADRGFTVEKFDDVNKIVIKHVKMQPLIFTRAGKSWKLNGTTDVDPGVFTNIQVALTKMRMLYKPALASTTTVKESLKNNGIQVDVYTDDKSKPEKIFFVGTDTQKGDGTYMLLNGSEQPYVMHLPRLSGGLRSRFEQPEKNYRDKFIYKYSAEELESIQVEYPKDQSQSFRIQVGKELKLERMLHERGLQEGLENPGKVQSYVSLFESTGTEGLFNDFPMKDSLKSLIPDCVISLTLKSGVQVQDKFYSFEHFMERSGNYRTPQEIRSGNRVFILRNDKDLFLAQNRVVGSFFTGYLEFFPKRRSLK